MLDHHPHDGLRPARPEQDAPFLPEPLLRLRDGPLDRLRGRDGLCGPGSSTLTLISVCGYTSMTAASSESGLPLRTITSRSASAVTMPSPVVACSERITCPDCSPPREAPGLRHLLGDVPVPHVGDLVGYLHRLHRLEETEVAHHRDDDPAGQRPALLLCRGRGWR